MLEDELDRMAESEAAADGKYGDDDRDDDDRDDCLLYTSRCV